MSVPPLTHPRPKELKITDHWLADGSEFALTYVNDKGHFFVFYFQYSKKERCLHWIERRYAIKIDFNFKEQITNCTWDSAYEIIRIKQEQGNVNIVKKGKESDFYDLIDQLPRLLALS